VPPTVDPGLAGTRGTARSGSARLWVRENGRLLFPIVTGLLAFGVAGVILAWATHDRPVLRVQIAFDSKACCTWQVWIGGSDKGDMALLPVRSGTSTEYSVPVFHSNIDRLYITTGSQPGGRARIERVRITRGSRTVSEVSTVQLQGATVYQATGRPTSTGLVLSSTGSQPAIDLPVSLKTHEGQLRISLARLVSERLLAVAAIIVLGSVLLAFLGASARRRGLTLCAAVLATIVAVRGTPWLSWKLHFHDDVSQAVGYATYVGLWKGRDRFVLESACVLAVAVATLLGLAYRRFWDADQGDDVGHLPPAPRPLAAWVAPIAIIVPVALVALAAVPNLRLYIGPAAQHVPSWDANNLIFWQYLIQTTHLAPMKDFFWPYGFQWILDKPAPWGVLATFGWYLTFWVLLAIGTWTSLSRFFGGRALLLRYVVLAGLWVTAGLTSDVPFQTRYIAPLSAVLLFAGIEGRDRWWSWKRLVFALALLDAAVFEPAQAIYATVPILILAALGFAADERRFRGHRIAWAVRTTTTIALPLVASALVYIAAGVAGATVTFYETGVVASSAYAFPTQVDSWVASPSTLESLIFWSVPLTLAIGAAGLLLRRDALRQSYAVVAALGALGLMIMQKQILRPHIATQVWFALVFGLAYWAVTDTILAPRRRWPVVLAFGGIVAALALVSGGYRSGWQAVKNGPSHVQGTIHELIHGRETFAKQAKGQFAPATFANFSDSWPVVHALQRVPRVARGGSVWILGDDSPLTMMLGRSWPYYYNDMYDASPIGFQKEILARLKRTPPARVVWNFRPAALIFDQVPMPVRVPLLYDWAVRNLAPERRVGHFEILRGRRSGEPIPLAWWRGRLGRTIDLGHIPAVAKLSGEPCSSGPRCGTFLVIRFGPGTPKQADTILPVRVAGLPFEVSFKPGPESRYVIPLNRVWFWSGAAGQPRSVLAKTLPGGPQIDVVHRTIDDDVLY
jgi:hypothetical protein